MKYTWFLTVALFASCGSQFESEQTGECCTEYGDSLRVMSLNMAHGRGTSFHEALLPTSVIERNLRRIAEVARDERVDIAGLQEADRSGANNLNYVAMVAELADFTWWVSGAHSRLGSKKYGTGIVGRAGIPTSETVAFSTFGPWMKKGYTVSTIKFGGEEVDLISLHLDPLLKVRRKQQAEQVAERVSDRGRPCIIVGDFNAEWGEGQAATILTERLGLRAYEPESHDLATFGERRLDWILVSDELDFEEYYVVPDEVSDHKAVVAELAWR